MSLFKSIFWGNEGSYHLLGVDVFFRKEDSTPRFDDKKEGAKKGFFIPHLLNKGFQVLVKKCFNSPLLLRITLGYAHLFVHEMGHALTQNLLMKEASWKKKLKTVEFVVFGRNNKVNSKFRDAIKKYPFEQKVEAHILVDRGGGYFQFVNDGDRPWKHRSLRDSIVSLAGPMADIAFSNAILIAATVFKDVITLPLAATLAGGAGFWLSGELLYALTSGLSEDNGDFGHISKNSKTHLCLASLALIGQCALGILTAYKCL